MVAEQTGGDIPRFLLCKCSTSRYQDVTRDNRKADMCSWWHILKDILCMGSQHN